MQVNISYITVRTLELPDEYLPLYEAAKKADGILSNINRAAENYREKYQTAYENWPHELTEQFAKDMEMLFPDGQVVYADIREGEKSYTIYEV